jgi:hypothetical protein
VEFEKHKLILRKYKNEHPFVFYFLVIYLGGILIYICIFLGIYADYANPLEFNEVGDFLAGIFSPIAFLFLYLGYRQNSEALKLQAKELGVSNKALQAQVAELKCSVEQQKELVRTSKQEFDFTVEQFSSQKQKEMVLRQPFLHLNKALIYRNVNKPYDPDRILDQLEDHEFDELQVEITLLNSRAIARDVRLSISRDTKGIFLCKTFNVFSTNSMENLIFKLDYPGIFDKENKVRLELLLIYLDELDNQMQQRYLFEIHRNSTTWDFSKSFYLFNKSY